MKLSLAWLGDYVNFKETDPEKIAAAVTAHIAEVDDVEDKAAIMKNCCVGKIISLGKHPNADRLSVCAVQTDRGVKEVVCGGTNLREGMRIAFAHVGATVRAHGGDLFTLTNATIRGVESKGMICAAEELELTDRFPPQQGEGARPIIDLGNGDEGVGQQLADYLGVGGSVLHIDNHAITHRADLFSHIGFARELVAIGIATWKKKPEFSAPKFAKEKVPFDFKVHEKKLMPRYCACLIEIDGLGETPYWMRERIEAVGWRSINLPIDITNFVATEVGVPLHSFDADDIKGTVHMRTAKQGETIVTLDNQKRTLPEGALILSDDEGVFDLLGIMGGLRSSTKETTRHIYLHSASLDPVSIRSTVIATGHRTDAATVYEKGVPHITTEQGFNRAVNLILELVPGARIVSRKENLGDNGKGKAISVSVKYIESMLGAKIGAPAMKKILMSLGCTVTGSGDKLKVTPPLWRLKDLTGSHDLVEEVGRIYGYNKIEAELPSAPVRLPARDMRIHKVRQSLKESGYLELLPLSITSPDVLEACGLSAKSAPEIANPIGRELSVMTTSTLPALLTHAGTYLRSEEQTLRTFHVSMVFKDNHDDHRELGLLIAAKSDTRIPEDSFLQAKQELELALQEAGYSLSLDTANHIPQYGHPGRSASILCDGKSVGMITELHPAIRKKFDLPARAAFASVDLTALLRIAPTTVIAKPLPEHPHVSYDITFTADAAKPLGNLLEKIRKSSSLLESVSVYDLYGGKPLAPNAYNVTLRCVYRAKDRTLTEEETKKEFAAVEKLVS